MKTMKFIDKNEADNKLFIVHNNGLDQIYISDIIDIDYKDKFRILFFKEFNLRQFISNLFTMLIISAILIICSFLTFICYEIVKYGEANFDDYFTYIFNFCFEFYASSVFMCFLFWKLDEVDKKKISNIIIYTTNNNIFEYRIQNDNTLENLFNLLGQEHTSNLINKLLNIGIIKKKQINIFNFSLFIIVYWVLFFVYIFGIDMSSKLIPEFSEFWFFILLIPALLFTILYYLSDKRNIGFNFERNNIFLDNKLELVDYIDFNNLLIEVKWDSLSKSVIIDKSDSYYEMENLNSSNKIEIIEEIIKINSPLFHSYTIDKRFILIAPYLIKIINDRISKMDFVKNFKDEAYYNNLYDEFMKHLKQS
jgi:hypothetical protein